MERSYEVLEPTFLPLLDGLPKQLLRRTSLPSLLLLQPSPPLPSWLQK